MKANVKIVKKIKKWFCNVQAVDKIKNKNSFRDQSIEVFFNNFSRQTHTDSNSNNVGAYMTNVSLTITIIPFYYFQ